MSEDNKKQYPQVEDLGIGKHIITGIKTMPVFEEVDGKKKPVADSHKHGEKGDFKWWMYSFKNKDDKYVTLFGNEKNKSWLDSGTVEVAILHKEVNNEPCYKVVDGKPVPILISFVNEAKGAVQNTPKTPIGGATEPSVEEEIDEQIKAEGNGLPF